MALPPHAKRRRLRRSAKLVPPALAVGLAASGMAAVAGAVPAVAESLPSPLVHYTFDDAPSTAVVTDSSGNGLNGTLVNSSTASQVPGADGSALKLPGGAANSTGAYVRLPRGVIAGATDLTVSERVKWDGGGAWQRLFDLGTDTNRYLFTTPTNGSALRTAITTGGAGSEAQVTGYAPLPSGTWKTVTVTLDTAAHRLTTYLDGAAVSSASTSITAGSLLSSTATAAGYIGKSFYGDPLLAGAVDDFTVYTSALTPAQVAAATGLTPPTPVTLAQTSFSVTTQTGTAPALPVSVRSTFTDGYDRDVPIDWAPVDPSQYAKRGTFTVTGAASGQTVTATVRVVLPGEITVDLGSTTGAFHGGASGTLYGVYGDGVPSRNLLEGMGLRTVATKAQDGPQHPGADALEVVKPLADSSGGDVYIYMTDIYRGFPYEWPGSTPEEKLVDFKAKIAKEVDQVLTLDPKYQKHIVFVPFNEPEGNMFGTGQWSYDGISWLNNPKDYFQAWDDVYHLIKGKMPDARIAGPNTSVLFDQVQGFLKHAIAAGTMPDVITWHELSNPASIRTNVAKFRGWEDTIYEGTGYEGKHLPVNLDEYAYNYHTSVPGQMIQWISAIEDSKVDADIAYWNIDGNLSDSAVQANRGNGQWWLFNAYSSMSGDTVKVVPPSPNVSYTLQGVATLDTEKKQARLIFGGADGPSHVQFDHVPAALGSSVHALVQEIPWTGQIGDSAQPRTVAELDANVTDGSVAFDFGSALPALKASSAYQIILSPGQNATSREKPTTLWQATYEAENASYIGGGYSKNGPEGRPSNVAGFYTSGGYDVGGLRTGSNGQLNFTVNVPQDGTYDLSVFANSLNTYALVADQGPTNVFLRVDGAAEQELYLTLGYKWVVWDHTDTKVQLTKGQHTITLAAQSLDGTKSTKGDVILDKIDLSLPNPAAATSVYEAEDATLTGATTDYSHAGVSGAGTADLGTGDSATFWVYSAKDALAKLRVDTLGGGTGEVTVNGKDVTPLGASTSAKVFLAGGVNKVQVTGTSGTLLLDRLRVDRNDGASLQTWYEAEDAKTAGTASVASYSLASGGKAFTGVGGDPGNGNTVTFTVTAKAAGTNALTIRYSNPEQSPATHYNPDTVARHADISINGGAPQRVLFPPSFHQNNFWELTVPVQLKPGTNTITFSSEELPDFDGTTYISSRYPDDALRSKWAPILDKIGIAPYVADELRGFSEPVATDGVTSGKAGTIVPLKFQVFRGQTEITDASEITSITYAPASTGAAVNAAAAGGTALRYDTTNGQFLFNWKTPGTQGDYRLTVTTRDGSTLTAQFRLG